MKLPRRPLKRVATLTTAVVVVAGAAAIADTSTVDVTLGVVNGERSLAVTGVDGLGAPVGAPNLAFGSTSTSAPFGVVVTDLAYKRTGYSVSATLSDLHRLSTTGVVDCTAGAEVPSDAVSVSFDALPGVTDVFAQVEPFLTYTDDAADNVNSLLTLSLASLPVTVADFAGFVQELDASGLTLMTVTDGAGGTFTASDDHPDCGTGAAGTAVALQDGATAEPSLSGLTTTLFDSIESDVDADAVIDVAETLAADVLPDTADDAGTVTSDGGILWEATRDALTVVLADAGITITDPQLVSLTTDVVADLKVASTLDLALSLVGQSGVYPNLPVLNIDRAKTEGKASGLYHGVMTVTLVDDTTP